MELVVSENFYSITLEIILNYFGALNSLIFRDKFEFVSGYIFFVI